MKKVLLLLTLFSASTFAQKEAPTPEKPMCDKCCKQHSKKDFNYNSAHYGMPHAIEVSRQLLKDCNEQLGQAL
ncbi:hypothetical protein [Shewanella violacea]|uniref:Orphan protein n=1 Tax=Shewanella violacea (strain JCM 10179 / CIP 106290 / LMG 19151 / DSS12) TaxID=637905 RepID=D4ZJT4_SHEVD|nr:hypothetical protein [Shewanella violacea]BAJ01933.1 hypothetical protein SVI_1962 [Shewanella violacea DSS12]